MTKMLPCDYDLPLSGLGFCQFYAPHKVFHPGVDLNKGSGDQDCGNEVLVAKDGKIVYMNTKESTGHGFGLFMIVKHEDGNYTRYAHLGVMEPLQEGEYVTKGQRIGVVGKTGPTSYCHCHFEVFTEDTAQIQRQHVHPWCFYPSGKSEAWVRQHYLEPFAWLQRSPAIPDWAKEAVDWAKQTGLIVDWANPYHIVGDERLEWTLEKKRLLDPSKHEGHVTLLRWAMVLWKMAHAPV